jgi:hypothetical protein
MFASPATIQKWAAFRIARPALISTKTSGMLNILSLHRMLPVASQKHDHERIKEIDSHQIQFGTKYILGSANPGESSDPVPLLQFQGQVNLGQILKPKGRQSLDLCLDLAGDHYLELLHPLWVGLDEVLLELQMFT